MCLLLGAALIGIGWAVFALDGDFMVSVLFAGAGYIAFLTAPLVLIVNFVGKPPDEYR